MASVPSSACELDLSLYRVYRDEWYWYKLLNKEKKNRCSTKSRSTPSDFGNLFQLVQCEGKHLLFMLLCDTEVTPRLHQFLMHKCSWIIDLSITASPIKVNQHYLPRILIANNQICIPKVSMHPPLVVKITHKGHEVFGPRLEVLVCIMSHISILLFNPLHHHNQPATRDGAVAQQLGGTTLACAE